MTTAFGPDNAEGAVLSVLQAARTARRTRILESMTVIDAYERHFTDDGSTRRLDEDEHRRVETEFEDYQCTVPEGVRSRRREFYDVKATVGKMGFGSASAGLPSAATTNGEGGVDGG